MLKSNKFSAQYRIYYEDTDAGGVVYYANYLKFFERARTDFLRALGISQHELIEKENIAFVVRRCELDFISPARLDDLVDVSVIVEKIGGVSIVMRQEMTLEGKMLAQLVVKIASIDVDGFKPREIPQNIKNLMEG